MYDNTIYDIRVGVSIKIPWIDADDSPYGHFYTEIFARQSGNKFMLIVLRFSIVGWIGEYCVKKYNY